MPTFITEAEKTVRVIIACRTIPGIHRFEVSPQLSVDEFLAQVLDYLSENDPEGKLASLRSCYDPVLELQQNHNSIPLESHATLQQAGITDQAVCRIAGNPRKEEIMFCRHN